MPRTQEEPRLRHVDTVGNQIADPPPGGIDRKLRESDGDGLLPALSSPLRLQGTASNPEHPCARIRQVNGHVVKTPPGNQHDVTHHIFGALCPDTPAYETKQVDVHRVEEAPETPFALRRRG